jgi:membrane protease YdiL (CAAX protease family)
MKTIFQNLKESIKRYPVEAFFIIAIGIMFGFLFTAIYLIPGDTTIGQVSGYYFSRISVYSPIISGIIVTRILFLRKGNNSFFRKLKFIVPVWLVALIIQVADIKLTAPSCVSLTGLVLLAIPVSFLPAWVISSAISGSDSIRKLLATLVKPGGGIVYYLVALLTFPFIMVAGSVIANIINDRAWFPAISQLMNLSYTVLISFLSVLFYAGGINEEAGWRGFAQKRLQSKYSPIVTVFILWIFMVIWHIPNDLLQYQNGGYLMVRIMAYPFITILFSWIFNRTGGSILAVAIFHASMNSMNPLMGIFPITTAGNIILIIFAVIVVFADKMWRKLPEDHPAVEREISNTSE